ncbi:MAG TPA: PorP/SprF family type IX secretion system membrane protein [Chitinophagaceae bacterium]|nr:PorP/SprF family type IX secretion system membrane protein [Chitinophagaceae bacterium]
MKRVYTINKIKSTFVLYPISLKMRNRIHFTTIIVLFMLFGKQQNVQAQDVHFSQFFEAPFLRNPSFSGLFQGDIRFQGIYRSQWASVTTPFTTGSFNFEYKKPIGGADDFLTLGMQMLYDKAGSASLTTTSFLPALNYHKALSGEKNKYLSLGIMGGFVQRKFDRSKITTNSHYDGNGYNPSLPDGETFLNSNFNYLDGSIGLSFNSTIGGKAEDNYFIGVAYHHLNRPKNSFYKNPDIELQAKMVVSTGIKFSLNETSYFTIHADYSKQGSFTELIGGAMYSYKIGDDIDNPKYTFHVGAFMRAKDAFIPMIKLDYHPFAFSFSYDANVSQLRTASQGRGAMEFSISYTGFFDRDNSSKFVPLCPKF